jgi:type II secretory pathway pseudopilin PulG
MIHLEALNYNSHTRSRIRNEAGFSVVELLVVVIIVLIAAAAAVPSFLSALRMGHLRGAASDYAGLLEVGRSYAIRDNRYYSTYILSAATGSPVAMAYVDMLPQSLTGASGNLGTGVTTGDPVITIESDIVVIAATSAPSTNNLKNQLLPSTTPVTPTDTSVTPMTFGPRGLPCTPNSAMTGGTVCDSSGGPTAFWTFLKNTKSSTWEAVTVTPAGRIEKWLYTGSAWKLL